MASRSKADLNEILVDAYDKACAEYLALYPNEPQPFLTTTYRSNDEQTELYAQGRTNPGKVVTNAKAGDSPHNYKPASAFDTGFITVNNKLDWRPILFQRFADIICKIQPLVKWGGSFKTFKDAPHYELLDWRKYVK